MDGAGDECWQDGSDGEKQVCENMGAEKVTSFKTHLTVKEKGVCRKYVFIALVYFHGVSCERTENPLSPAESLITFDSHLYWKM